jgi:hypothetical protein
MQPRQLSYVAEFTTDIWHIPGMENIVADALSRPPLAAFTAAATGGPAVAAVAASPVNLDYARIAVLYRGRAVKAGRRGYTCLVLCSLSLVGRML